MNSSFAYKINHSIITRMTFKIKWARKIEFKKQFRFDTLGENVKLKWHIYEKLVKVFPPNVTLRIIYGLIKVSYVIAKIVPFTI